ncbi:MAG: BamA/TamA family outer membrane protein [Nevskia sp.]
MAGIDVQVRGLGSDERSNAYAQLSILEYAKRTDADNAAYDGADVQRLFKQGEAEIKAALQPFGWYNVTVTSELQGAAPDWTATYTVDAGPETDVAKIDIRITGEGLDYAPLRRLVERPRPLKLGERLKHEDYEALKTRLVQTAYAAGLLDATLVKRELRIDVPNNAAEVELELDSGRRYRFGDITIAQDGHLHEDFLRRYITFRSGDYYDPGKVLGTQFALGDLDYFQSVDLDSPRDKADAEGRIPITITTVEKAPRSYKYGLGYGTDTGPRASIGAAFRRINNSGHKLSLDLRVSPVISTAVAEYRIPFGHVPSDSISFTTQALTQNFSDVKETLYRFGTSYNRQGKLWQRRIYLDYSVDDYTIKDSPRRTSALLVPGVSFNRTSADDPIFPRYGWYAFLDTHGGATAVLSDTNFVQGLVKLRSTLYLGQRFYLLSRIDQGGTYVGSFDNLPPSQRFFAGGDDSVRGYSYQSLGPRDAHGRVIGGKFLTTASSEIDWYYDKTYGLAVFGDAGGADNDPLVHLALGAGAGLRYRAPFGSFALDLAHPFEPGYSPVRLHIGVRVGL